MDSVSAKPILGVGPGQEVLVEPSDTGLSMHLVLNRPSWANALDAATARNLMRSIDHAVTTQARAVILRGVGPHFCSGFDFSNIESKSHGDLLLQFVLIELFLQQLCRSPIATVAVASGRTLGAGADLFLACDHRLCFPDATFSFPGPSFGIVLGSRRIADRVGREMALDILDSGRTIDAKEAVQIGLASEIVEEPELGPRLKAIEEIVARLDALTVASIKSATLSGELDSDIAYLVRSASHHDLKDRIVAYRSATRISRLKGDNHSR